MPGFQSHYNAAVFPEDFAASCQEQQSSGSRYFVLSVGPLTLYAREGQLRQVSQAIDAALLDAERQRVARREVVPGWTTEEILAREG